MRLVGGLGNQLFGYAAGYVAAQDSQRLLELDTSWTRHGITDHGVDIRHFDLPGRWLPDARIGTRLLPPGTKIGRLAAAASVHLARKTGLPGYVTEFPRDPSELSGGLPRVFFRGYFHEQRIAETFLAGLPCGLRLKQESHWLTKMTAIARDERPIGVHVRLGDYKTLPGGQALDFDYYKSAIAAALAQLGSRPVWIFTDDPSEIGQLTQLTTTCRVVDAPNTSNPAEELLLFSRMDGYVIANSTFSWWGAILGRKAARTWRPDPWFTHGTPTILVPEDWIPVSARHLRTQSGTA